MPSVVVDQFTDLIKKNEKKRFDHLVRHCFLQAAAVERCATKL